MFVKGNRSNRYHSNFTHLRLFVVWYPISFMAVSLFDIRSFLIPYLNLAKNVFSQKKTTTPVNSFPSRLIIPSLISSSGSPSFHFITVPNRILLPTLTFYLLFICGWILIRVSNNMWVHGMPCLVVFLDYCWGHNFEHLVSFGGFYQTNIKNKQTLLH